MFHAQPKINNAEISTPYANHGQKQDNVLSTQDTCSNIAHCPVTNAVSNTSQPAHDFRKTFHER